MDISRIDDFLAGYGVVIHQDDPEEILAHFGVKGMHWGIRKSTDEKIAKNDRRITNTKAQISAHETAIHNIKSHIKDANENGVDSELFKSEHGGTSSSALFAALHGQTINSALADHKEDLQDTLAEHAFGRDLQTDRLARLQKRGAKLQARKAAQSA